MAPCAWPRGRAVLQMPLTKKCRPFQKYACNACSGNLPGLLGLVCARTLALAALSHVRIGTPHLLPLTTPPLVLYSRVFSLSLALSVSPRALLLEEARDTLSSARMSGGWRVKACGLNTTALGKLRVCLACNGACGRGWVHGEPRK